MKRIRCKIAYNKKSKSVIKSEPNCQLFSTKHNDFGSNRFDKNLKWFTGVPIVHPHIEAIDDERV